MSDDKGHFVAAPFAKLDEGSTHKEEPSRKADRGGVLACRQFAMIGETRLVDRWFKSVSDSPEPLQELRFVEHLRGESKLCRECFTQLSFRLHCLFLSSREPLPNPFALPVSRHRRAPELAPYVFEEATHIVVMPVRHLQSGELP